MSAAGTLHTKTQGAGRCLPAIPNNATARARDLPRVSRRRHKEDTGLHLQTCRALLDVADAQHASARQHLDSRILHPIIQFDKATTSQSPSQSTHFDWQRNLSEQTRPIQLLLIATKNTTNQPCSAQAASTATACRWWLGPIEVGLLSKMPQGRSIHTRMLLQRAK